MVKPILLHPIKLTEEARPDDNAGADQAAIDGVPASGFAFAVNIESSSSAHDFVRYAIGTQLRSIFDHEASARIGADPDGIHQVRAAARRLRTHIAHLDGIINDDWARSTRKELQWLGRQLGAARDLDVMRDILSACAASLPPAEVQQLEPLFTTIAAQRQAAHRDLCKGFDSARYRKLVALLSRAVQEPPMADGSIDETAVITRAITQLAWSRLSDAVEELGATPTDAALHHVRRRAKRARFAAELAIPIVDGPARKLAKSLASVQNVLGVQHDAVVAHQWVKIHASRESSEVNFSAGMVAGLLRNASQSAAREFPQVWQRASRKKLRAWL